MEVKVCNTCNIEQPLTNYWKKKESPDGRDYCCKGCKKELRKSHKASDEARINRQERDRERRRVLMQTEEGRNRLNEITRRYRDTEKYKQWIESNKDRIQEKNREKALLENSRTDIKIIKCVDCGKIVVIRVDKSLKRNSRCNKCYANHTYRTKYSPNKEPFQCKQCGCFFKRKHSKVYCSTECRQIGKKQTRKEYLQSNGPRPKNQLARARRYGCFRKYNVRPEKVFKRDKWKCSMCGCKVQKNNIHASDAAELDHIVPLSLGGPHTYSNVQTACRKCNIKKSNSFKGQLVLSI